MGSQAGGGGPGPLTAAIAAARLDRMFIWTPAVPGAIDLMSSEAESLRAITKEEERLAKEAEALAEEASRLEAMSVEEWGAAQPEADDAGPPEGGEAGGCWGSVPPPPIAQLRSEETPVGGRSSQRPWPSARC
ncbi:unnamed protein product [Prorocentrum cordatum]|uniref:Uncharacterized protein n=1 Tax=Prorocentrum cordatum TaxID=2364126 RepID=A0ABN9XE57_9DINO|nr:unnamed protein product [Polarella glacialis]